MENTEKFSSMHTEYLKKIEIYKHYFPKTYINMKGYIAAVIGIANLKKNNTY